MFKPIGKNQPQFLRKIALCAVTFLLIMLNTTCFADTCKHRSSTWKVDESSYDVVTGTVWEKCYCDICGAYKDMRIKSIPLDKDGIFIFTPEEFCERFDRMSRTLSKYYNGTEYTSKIELLDNRELIMAVRVSNNTAVAGIQFADTEQLMTEKSKDVACISCVMVYLFSDSPSDWADVMVTTTLACSTSLEVSDATEIVSRAFLSSSTGIPYSKNGISYAFSPVDGGYMFVVSLLGD